MSDSCNALSYSLPGSSVHGKNTRVGCHFLLQGIFPIQELNSGLLHYRQILYQLSYKGSLKISLVIPHSCLVLRSFPIFDILSIICNLPRWSLDIERKDSKVWDLKITWKNPLGQTTSSFAKCKQQRVWS